jgi:methionyl-tRNA formyltransferase
VRIAFFGLPIAAWLLHGDGHDVAYAAISRPDAAGRRRLARAIGADRVELKPDAASRRVRDRVRAAAPDLVVSWFWTTKLPMDVVATASLGGIGVHPSLLPRHRGPDPYFWAIDAGDAVTGVTAHRLAAEYDTGAILGQRVLPLDPSFDAWTLARRLDRPSLALLREVVHAYARGAPPRELPQDEASATEAPTPVDEALEIDWTWSTDRIERRIRAASPWPGAWAFFGDEPLTVLRARTARAFPRALAPGEAAVVDGSAVVRTGDGALTLLEGRMDAAEGEPPYELTAADLAALVEELGSGSQGSSGDKSNDGAGPDDR